MSEQILLLVSALRLPCSQFRLYTVYTYVMGLGVCAFSLLLVDLLVLFYVISFFFFLLFIVCAFLFLLLLLHLFIRVVCFYVSVSLLLLRCFFFVLISYNRLSAKKADCILMYMAQVFFVGEYVLFIG